MSGPAGDPAELEPRLRAEMEAAAHAYHQAIAEQQSAMAHYKDLSNYAASAFAPRTASASERLALEKYARAVKRYADLVVRGKTP